MKIIDWNISYDNDTKPKKYFLKTVIDHDSFIIILQEVTPSQFTVFKSAFSSLRYSLDYREAGKFDTRQRQLGILIICSDDVKIKAANVLNRTLLPDRTLMVEAEYGESTLRIIGMHSITGIAHKKAKSMQFLSQAEAVDEFKPDIVALDANEPAEDHFDTNKMKFFNNLDNGYGANTFFRALRNTGLIDLYIDG